MPCLCFRGSPSGTWSCSKGTGRCAIIPIQAKALHIERALSEPNQALAHVAALAPSLLTSPLDHLPLLLLSSAALSPSSFLYLNYYTNYRPFAGVGSRLGTADLLWAMCD